MSVTLETADEALDESYEASLRASSKTRAELYIPVDLNGFDGSFEILELRGTERANPGSAKIENPGFHITLTEFGSEGQLSGGLTEVSGTGPFAAVSLRGAGFAAWPAESPCASGFPIGLDDAPDGHLTASGLVASINATDALPWVWSDGAETELVLRFEPDQEIACGGVEFDDGMDVAVHVAATLTSADGRLSGTLPVQLYWGSEGEGGTTEVLAALDPSASFSPADIASLFPELDMSLDEFDQMMLWYSTSLSVGPDSVEVTRASIEAHGGVDPMCNPDPGEPCTGLQLTPLERGELAPRARGGRTERHRAHRADGFVDRHRPAAHTAGCTSGGRRAAASLASGVSSRGQG